VSDVLQDVGEVVEAIAERVADLLDDRRSPA
jgi:hypothetical protein